MPAKLVNLKAPPQEKTEAKPCNVGERDKWRYGFRLSFDEQLLKAIPSLKSAKVGDRCKIVAEGCVVGVRSEEKPNGEEKHTVDVQLEGIGLENKEDYDEAFDEATGKKKDY